MGRSLPVLQSAGSSRALRPDGSRDTLVPGDVSGRFNRLRRLTFSLLLVVYALLPWIQINGAPAVFLDLERRAFYLFGATFNAQDMWLAFFLLSGAGFALIAITAVLGRVWCGYACPQTVFLDGVFRRVERLIEGPRNARMARDAAPIGFARIWRKTLKHASFVLLSALVAHIFLSYFVSLPAVWKMVHEAPSAHPEAFAWAFGLTAVMYFNFAWFREQMCLIICPYGRLQSVLTDADTLVIGYDQQRGEPRGKAKEEGRGQCVDCGRCVVVCPTGIDIRNGLQLDCIGCSACVDACDDVMKRMKQPTGLIRYDSLNGLSGRVRRVLRPRVYLYGLLALIGLVVAGFASSRHVSFEANLLRLQGAPFTLESDGRVRNRLELHLVNKRAQPVDFVLTPVPGQALDYVLAQRALRIESFRDQRVPVFVTGLNDGTTRTVRIVVDDASSPREVEAKFVAPR